MFKLSANFMEDAEIVRLIVTILGDRWAEKRSAPSVADGSFVVDRFYMALFSSIQQTHCTRIYNSPLNGAWVIYHSVP